MAKKDKTILANRLREIWFEGATTSALADRLGCSRSSISGIYSRNPELKQTHPLSGMARNSNPAIRNTYEQRIARIDAIRDARSKPAPEVSDQPGRYDVMTLPANGCKWPHGDTRITFCGHQREGTSPYCLAHMKLAYTPRAMIQMRKAKR